jgi:cytochrome d ubiquinol oxidase subunit I
VSDALLWHRLQFAFTAVFHYIFPALTMGLVPMLVVAKGMELRTKSAAWASTSEFLARIFALNFAVGVVTGIPMEFQFGTNWAGFSTRAGSIIGQTLGMEGMFAFFLESTSIGLFLWGKKRIGVRGQLVAGVFLWLGVWMSAYFIVVTNAFMQHPVGYAEQDGKLVLESLSALLLHGWAWVAFTHAIAGAVVTAGFVVAAIGALYTLSGTHPVVRQKLLLLGVTAGLLGGLLVAFPTGDQQAKMVAKHQPVALAAMEGRFESGPVAGITLIGQPNVKARSLDNPIRIPGALSFLAYGTFHDNVRGLGEFQEADWPDNIELLYYSFHLMAGIGTVMIGIMGLAAFLLWRKRLEKTRLVLYALLVSFPLPYIANTAGWLTAELGRQPWLLYGLMRTRDGASRAVHSGSALFTLIGFCGLYFVLGLLFVFLVAKQIRKGPAHV